VFILPHAAKAAVILPFVRHDWLHWSCDKDDVAIGNPERHVRKASHHGSKQQ